MEMPVHSRPERGSSLKNLLLRDSPESEAAHLAQAPQRCTDLDLVQREHRTVEMYKDEVWVKGEMGSAEVSPEIVTG